MPREVLERYVGRYALGPAVLTIALTGGGTLTAQATGQPVIPLTATGEATFRTQGIDASLTTAVLVTQAFLPAMVEQASGRVIMM